MRTSTSARRRVTYAVLPAALLVAGMVPSIGAEPLTLVEDGTPVASVVVSESASASIRDAATDLIATIREMSGAALPVVSEIDGPSIVIGARTSDRDLHPLAYHIAREGDTLYLSGATGRGVVNAVYAFLELELRCRWYVPGPLGTYIPTRRTITVGDIDLRDGPDFDYIGGFGSHPDGEAGRKWLVRNRLVGFPNAYHSHNWQNIVDPAARAVRPELFSTASAGNKYQLCTTHPDVLDSAVAAARRHFDRAPNHPMYSLSPNDNGKFCECERCLALDRQLGVDRSVPKTGWFTPRLVYFCNQVAERLAETHPGKFLAFYAYMVHTDPPETIKLQPNVIPVVCKTPWEHCVHHAVDDPECERNRRIAAAVEGWSAVASQVWIHEYYGHYHWFGPYGLVHTIRRDMPWMRERGVVGFTSETHANWWTQGLGFYVAVKLAWDLDTDVDALVSDYYGDLYGLAARHMLAYGLMFEDLLRNVPYDRDWERSFVRDVTPRFVAQAGARLDSAAHALRDAPVPDRQRGAVSMRLRKVRAGHELMASQAQVMRMDPEAESPMSLVAEMEADSDLRDVAQWGLAPLFIPSDVREARLSRRVWDETSVSDTRRRDLLAMFRENRWLEVARGLGFITDWHVIGLFPASPGRALSGLHPPEDEVDLDAAHMGRYGEVRWRAHRTDNPYGIIDLRRMFWPEATDSSVVYLYTEVENHDGPRPAHVRLGSNDGVVLWHNGERVLLSDTERPLALDQDRLVVRLLPGTNTFLAKVNNTDHNFAFAMRLLSRDGMPLPITTRSE